MNAVTGREGGSTGSIERSLSLTARRLGPTCGVVFVLAVSLLTAATSPAYANALKITPPGAPTGVEAVGVNTAIGVSWTAPISDGGSPITGYVVTVSKSNRTCTTTGATTCTVSRLTNGTKYKVTVQAKNAKGEGPASAPVKATPSNSQDCAYIGPYANLQNCDLSGTNLSNANLKRANLTDADLNGATLDGVSSGGIVGTPSSLPSDWTLVAGYLIGPGANLTDANLVSSNLSDADLQGANLLYANLEDADLTDADLADSIPERVDLTDANLTGATLTDATLINTTLTGANLTDATLSGASLVGVISGGVVGTPSSLPSDWTLVAGYLIGPEANLNYADLSDANLDGVDLTSATISDANLSGANLTDANLTNANLDGADLTGVTWNNTTCPDGTNSNNDRDTCINNLG